MKSFQPLLAATAGAIEDISLPVYASPKLDGIRVVVTGQGPLTRKLKPVPNRKLFDFLNRPELVGLDGEVIWGAPTAKDVMQKTTSGTMTIDGPDPREGGFCFHVFDDFSAPDAPFLQRVHDAGTRVNCLRDSRISMVAQHAVSTHSQLADLEETYVSEGYEGLMVRDVMGVYKFGRSTLREGILLKIKRFADAEAVIVDVIELERNHNEKVLDERGYSKRSTAQDGKIGGDTLGAIVVESPLWEKRFSIGSGFDARLKDELWSQRDSLIGRCVTFKHQPSGAKDVPRFPVFKGLRED